MGITASMFCRAAESKFIYCHARLLKRLIMWTELFTISGPWPARLTISARPRGEDWLPDEIRAWRAAGVDTVISLLTSEEITDLGLQAEARLCLEAGIRFDALPV